MFADKFNMYFPAALTIPSVTPLASSQAVGSWICNHDFMYFMEGKIPPNCIKKAESELRLPRCFRCQTYTRYYSIWSVQTQICIHFSCLWFFTSFCCYIFILIFVSHVTKSQLSALNYGYMYRLGRKTVNLAFLPLRKCRCFCDNPFSFSSVETSLFLYFYPGGREYKIIDLYF